MRNSVNYRETLVTYLRSSSIEEASEQLSIKPSVLMSRIAQMRRHGVSVPYKTAMADSLKSALYIAQLNSLIIKYKKEK